MNTTQTHSILVIDDEMDIRELMADILRDDGYRVTTAANSLEALNSLENHLPSLVILDIWLQGSELDGLGILEIIKRNYPLVPVIMISGHGTIETAVNAIKLGAYDYIEKPFKTERLTFMVKRALEAEQLKSENQELKRNTVHHNLLIGTSRALTHLKTIAAKVAPTSSRILITGPAGSGKETVARHIHALSHRAHGPFIILNASSISPFHVEEALFGREKREGNTVGNFPVIGTFERAHGGTLFLDEVGEMPLTTQAKLLRFLQERSFERIGGHKIIKSDVRVISAASSNLEQAIHLGTFRQDLYYRLNVVPVEVPPLGERRDDIPLLIVHFMEILSRQLSVPMRVITEDAMAVLQSYDWPGNVRQLRNVAEWLLIMTPNKNDSPIQASMLPSEILMNVTATQSPAMNADIMNKPLREARELFEKQYLSAQLKRFGNISKMAYFIQMERSALHRKLKSLGLTSENSDEEKKEYV